jgi:hypothetical protein
MLDVSVFQTSMGDRLLKALLGQLFFTNEIEVEVM